MSESRNRIFARLCERRPTLPAVQPVAPLPVPDLGLQQRIERFSACLEAVRAEVVQTPRAQWTAALKGLVREKRLGNLLFAPDGPLGEAVSAAWDEEGLPPLLERAAPIDEWKEELFYGIDAALTSTRGGIAETGTLILWPDLLEPRSYSLVPPVHIAVLDSADLHASFAEVVEREQWQQGLPTNVLLISGPSKSADIEQTLAYGVHGPTELIVLLLT